MLGNNPSPLPTQTRHSARAELSCACYAGPVFTPSNDSRSIEELVAAALGTDGELGWDAVSALHWRGSREVLERALALCRSPNATHRELGADILGQLGVPERTFPDECFAALTLLLTDADQGVLQSAIVALQHIDKERAVTCILPFCTHPNGEVRHAVAVALGGVEDAEATTALLALTADDDPHVRNWATFGVGRQSNADGPSVREALLARLQDNDPEVRYEAICGLGRRRDPRAVPYLKTMLHNDPHDVFAREAAARLVGLEEPNDSSAAELLGALQRMQRWRR